MSKRNKYEGMTAAQVNELIKKKREREDTIVCALAAIAYIILFGGILIADAIRG